MIYICIDLATIYCHSRYSMNRKCEYATDNIYNLISGVDIFVDYDRYIRLSFKDKIYKTSLHIWDEPILFQVFLCLCSLTDNIDAFLYTVVPTSLQVENHNR